MGARPRVACSFVVVCPAYATDRGRQSCRQSCGIAIRRHNNERCPQVEGCGTEAQRSRSGTRAMQGRACEHHRNVCSFVHEGQRMRFCWGCHRFQLLADFDGTSRRASSAHAPVAEGVL